MASADYRLQIVMAAGWFWRISDTQCSNFFHNMLILLISAKKLEHRVIPFVSLKVTGLRDNAGMSNSKKSRRCM
jgi:hypothetical protein